MSSTHFSIKYDGPALATHEMDVHELAPALMALSEMIKSANQALYGDKADVKVQVKGSFKGGSFGIDLTAAQTIYQQITSVLAGQGPTAFANLMTLLAALGLVGGGGLLALLVKLRGRKPIRIENQDNNTVFIITDEVSTERIEVDLATGKLWKDKTVRKSLQQVMRPLLQEGIDTFAAGRSQVPELVITSAESRWFIFDDASVELTSSIIEQVCHIESVPFKNDNKWKLNNGQTIYAFMEDASFLAAVNEGTIRFGSGDRLKVSMKVVQHERNGRLETSFHVLQVLDHHIGTQHSLWP